jgi:hypothetical protein
MAREALREDSAARVAALMWGVFAAPFAWAADEGISYAIVPHACSTGAFFWLHVITAFALVLAISALVVALLELPRTSHPRDENGAANGDWTWWTARFGIASSAWFIVVIVAQAVPRFILSPCD